MAILDLATLLKNTDPVLQPGKYYFATLSQQDLLPFSQIIASIREKEGLSVVVSEQTAQAYSLEVQFPCAWITLNIHSALEAVGLTAAFAKALAKAGISCNVVAGFYHDHIFVPFEQAQQAMAVLQTLS